MSTPPTLKDDYGNDLSPTVNGIGWEIQQYTHAGGWVALPGKPFSTAALAHQEMALRASPAANPLRVYEALS